MPLPLVSAMGRTAFGVGTRPLGSLQRIIPAPGVAKTWREALSFPGSTQMKYLDKFLTSIAWWTLRPDPNLITQQPQEMIQRVTFPERAQKRETWLCFICLWAG